MNLIIDIYNYDTDIKLKQNNFYSLDEIISIFGYRFSIAELNACFTEWRQMNSVCKNREAEIVINYHDEEGGIYRVKIIEFVEEYDDSNRNYFKVVVE